MNNNKKSRVIAGLLVGLLFAVTVSNTALAQSTPTESITLSPVTKQYDLDAGETLKDRITIINDGETDYNFIVYARPYYTTGTDYAPDFDSKRSNADSYKWVQFDKTKFFIKAGEKVDVQYTVRVPSIAAPGGHYGVLFAETQSSESTGESTIIGRNRRVGSIMYATVNGKFSIGGTIDNITTKLFQTSKPLTTTVNTSNSGNTDFMTNVDFNVKNLFGKVLFSEKKEYSILPDTTRSMEMKWEKSPIFGLYKTETSVKLLEQSKTSSNYVFLAPVWFYGFIVLAIIWLVVYVFIRRRR